MAKIEKFKYRKGTHILTIDNAHVSSIAETVTACYFELGRNVYDFVDNFGNPRWCFEEDIIFRMGRI